MQRGDGSVPTKTKKTTDVLFPSCLKLAMAQPSGTFHMKNIEKYIFGFIWNLQFKLCRKPQTWCGRFPSEVASPSQKRQLPSPPALQDFAQPNWSCRALCEQQENKNKRHASRHGWQAGIALASHKVIKVLVPTCELSHRLVWDCNRTGCPIKCNKSFVQLYMARKPVWQWVIWVWVDLRRESRKPMNTGNHCPRGVS